MRQLALCILSALLMGCSQNPSGEEQKSTVQNVVETMSQRKALEDGRKAGQQIRQIRSDQDKNLQEVE
jgi:hypothetical protein